MGCFFLEYFGREFSLNAGDNVTLISKFSTCGGWNLEETVLVVMLSFRVDRCLFTPYLIDHKRFPRYEVTQI